MQPLAEEKAAEAVSEGFPARYKIILSCMLAFVICNMVRRHQLVSCQPLRHNLPHIGCELTLLLASGVKENAVPLHIAAPFCITV